MVTEFSAAPDFMRRCQKALGDEARKPDAGEDLPRAKQVAMNYGERSRLCMRDGSTLKEDGVLLSGGVSIRASAGGHSYRGVGGFRFSPEKIVQVSLVDQRLG